MEDDNRSGYWAEDIVRKAMPSAYDSHHNSDGYSALDIIGDMYEDHDNGSDGGYYAMDYLGDMYGDHDNDNHEESNRGGSGGYFAMDVLAG